MHKMPAQQLMQFFKRLLPHLRPCLRLEVLLLTVGFAGDNLSLHVR
jgi:hypothetical protein